MQIHVLTRAEILLHDYWRSSVGEISSSCNAVSGICSVPWCEAAARVTKGLDLSYVRYLCAQWNTCTARFS